MNTPGKFLGIKVNGAFISCETSCSINFDIEMLPASATDSGGWKEFLYGIRGWSMTVNANLILAPVGADIKGILSSCLINRLPVFVAFSTRPSVDIQMVFSGAALLSGGNITAPAKGNANWNITFTGSGPLDIAYTDFALLIDAMPSLADYPIIVSEDV